MLLVKQLNNPMALEKIGRRLVLLFMALLPWSVIISVFGSEELHIGLFRFWKEAALASILIVFLLDAYRKKIQYSYDLLDIFIVLYILWLVGVSFFQQVPVVGYVYGLRYDAEFFLAFLFIRRIFPHWHISF